MTLLDVFSFVSRPDCLIFYDLACHDLTGSLDDPRCPVICSDYFNLFLGFYSAPIAVQLVINHTHSSVIHVGLPTPKNNNISCLPWKFRFPLRQVLVFSTLFFLSFGCPLAALPLGRFRVTFNFCVTLSSFFFLLSDPRIPGLSCPRLSCFELLCP